MLYRKIQSSIDEYLKNESKKMLIIEGARQIGKSFIVRHCCKQLFQNYIEINFVEDKAGPRLFANVNSTNDFYFQLSMVAGEKMGTAKDTVVFLDEIQEYPQFMTLIKFLKSENRFTYIGSGSMLGVALRQTVSIPIGSMEVIRMFPLDFEEFLIANNVGQFAIDTIRDKFHKMEALDQATHNKILDYFKKFLLVGGLPDAVNDYLENLNIAKVRMVQREVHKYYGEDASKYDIENKLMIKRVYDLIPSVLENKKKRIVAANIRNNINDRLETYKQEFDYLINSGVVLEVKAVSNPIYPLNLSIKNLIKLYLNDPGIFSGILYGENIRIVLDDKLSVNLGALYEVMVACELKAHGHPLFYYDNKKKGEVDFLIEDSELMSAIPIEVKSGKDYNIHGSLNNYISNYKPAKAFVLSNEREVYNNGTTTYLPIYYVMFL